MKLKFKRLQDCAVLPYFATEASAGMDLVATWMEHDERLGLLVYGTDLAVEIPKGHVGLLVPRSSISSTKNWLVNSVGIIDADYRGELIVKTDLRDSAGKYVKVYKPGERICQLVILKLPSITIVESRKLSETGRQGGFGSTGA